MNGGARVAAALERQGVRFLFTLCGGHISPILVGCKALGVRVIDVRDEANAVFAADGVARLTGVPGVAAVTAGPGVTNTLTALKNAQMAQSPVVLLGGAAATVLKGRGSLQDIDQQAVIAPHVKWSASVTRVTDIAPTLEEAFRRSLAGVPGPVFVELPIDLLYEEPLVRSWYEESSGGKKAKGLAGRALSLYLRRHLDRQFAGASELTLGARVAASPSEPLGLLVKRAKTMLDKAERPVVVVGSQALARPGDAADIARAVEALNAPTYLAGMARGLLGRAHPLHCRHKRTAALKEADLVILAGVPCDFRLAYGRSIGRKARVISANLDKRTLFKNRVPQLPVPGDPGRFLIRLAELGGDRDWPAWKATLQERDDAREEEIEAMAAEEAPPINPLRVVQAIEAALGEDSVLVADGGDFVATASYVVRPRGPLRWLDPGVFGTLGVGAGFALAAALVYPEAEVWLLYGDGAAGFSLIELDTFARHGLGLIAVVGNDAGWTQIARDQVVFLEDDVGTVLDRTHYDVVAQGLGGFGVRVESAEQLPEALAAAKAAAREGRPALVNVHLGKTEFRKGSISM